MGIKKEGIPFDGFSSALDILRRSDGAMVQRILMNIARNDPQLAQRLELALRGQKKAATVEMDDSRAALERSTRNARTRTYGL